jgi:hypothetical protein
MQKTRFVLSNLFIILTSQAFATELIQEFQSPSFSGNGFGQYVTQIEQTEYQRKKQREDEKAAKELEMKRQLESSNLYKFLNNVEARIYAELSKRLVDELFGDNPSDHGTIDFEGNQIEYTNDGINITLKVTDENGNVTTITIPVGAF